MARPREAVGCRTLICRKADSGQLNDLTTRQVELRDRQFVQPASCCVNTTAYLSPSGASFGQGRLQAPRNAVSLPGSGWSLDSLTQV